MSKPIKIEWPVRDNEDVCLKQSILAAGNFVIDGKLANKNPYAPTVATFPGIERTVSLDSDADMSAVNFTITGTLAGAVVSETIAGPDGVSVSETLGFFSTVTAVYADAAAADVSIGTGYGGRTIWLRSDYHRAENNLTVAVKVVGDITYTFETTLDDPLVATTPFIFYPVDATTVIPRVPAGTDMVDSQVSSSANYTWPTHSSRARISSSGNDGGLTFYFLQQGVV